MNSVEDAYQKLAMYVMVFVGGREWDSAGCNVRIFSKMASGSQWLSYQGKREEEGGFGEDSDSLWDGLKAAIFLRDDILLNSGDRIWGLSFTLYKDGNFNIEYDYEKPEGYE